jgi:hypothetical protein
MATQLNEQRPTSPQHHFTSRVDTGVKSVEPEGLRLRFGQSRNRESACHARWRDMVRAVLITDGISGLGSRSERITTEMAATISRVEFNGGAATATDRLSRCSRQTTLGDGCLQVSLEVHQVG